MQFREVRNGQWVTRDVQRGHILDIDDDERTPEQMRRDQAIENVARAIHAYERARSAAYHTSDQTAYSYAQGMLAGLRQAYDQEIIDAAERIWHETEET